MGKVAPFLLLRRNETLNAVGRDSRLRRVIASLPPNSSGRFENRLCTGIVEDRSVRAAYSFSKGSLPSVSFYFSGTASLSGQTVRKTIKAGLFPSAVAVNPATNRIYILNQGNDIVPGTVTVLDGASNRTTTISDPLAQGPIAAAVNPLTNRIYVVNNLVDPANFSVTVIDGATNGTTHLGGNDFDLPSGVAVNPVTNKIYVANGAGWVSVIDGATNAITRVTDPHAQSPTAVAVNPLTNKIYVTNEVSNNVTVIDGDTNAVTTLTDPDAQSPVAVTVNPVTKVCEFLNWPRVVTAELAPSGEMRPSFI